MMTRDAVAEEAPYFSVQMQLLHACNLRCAHCYDAAAGRLKMPDTAEMKRRLDAIYAFGRRRGFSIDMHLSGGEPTLRRDLVEIVRTIFQTHEGDALLFTNGTRFPLALARQLAVAGLEYVQVSLEGPEAETDEVRGAGVFRAAMQTLHMLRGEGFRCTVSITVTARNFPRLFSFLEELDPIGLHLHLREVFPIGSGKSLLGLTPEERRKLYEFAIAWNGVSTLGLEDPAHCSVSPAYARGQRGCVAGRNHFCVDVDGSIFPCRPLAHRVGSIDDLDAAWDSPDMLRIRRRDFGGHCGRCRIRQSCGGCRVYAKLDGDLFGEDRRCFADEHELVLTPLEHAAVLSAETIGRGIWRARRAAPRTLRRLPIAR